MTQGRRAVSAAAWLLGGQAFGFAWALLLVQAVGIGSYGQFATGVAAAGLLTIPLDAYFLIRAPRVDEDAFRADRTTRAWLGLVLLAAGCAVLPWSTVPGLALGKGGATVVFNALRSRAIRDGQPQAAQRADTVRALLCLACGTLAILLLDRAEVGTVVGAWLVGYAPFLLLAAPILRGGRPRAPEWSRRTGAIVLDALGGAAYLQGDVVLVGVLLGSTEAGRYGFGALVAGAVGAIGLNFGATYHERLRAAGGHWRAGPPWRHVIVGAGVLAALTAGLALVVGEVLPAAGLGPTLLVFAPVAATRFVSATLTTLLVVAGLDTARLGVTVAAIATKGTGILLCSSSVEAAVAFALGDLVLIGGALLVLHRRTRVREVAP